MIDTSKALGFELFNARSNSAFGWAEPCSAPYGWRQLACADRDGTILFAVKGDPRAIYDGIVFYNTIVIQPYIGLVLSVGL
jgi:hypothetical protein